MGKRFFRWPWCISSIAIRFESRVTIETSFSSHSSRLRIQKHRWWAVSLTSNNQSRSWSNKKIIQLCGFCPLCPLASLLSYLVIWSAIASKCYGAVRRQIKKITSIFIIKVNYPTHEHDNRVAAEHNFSSSAFTKHSRVSTRSNCNYRWIFTEKDCWWVVWNVKIRYGLKPRVKWVSLTSKPSLPLKHWKPFFM